MNDAILDRRLLFVSEQPELVRSFSEDLRLLCEFSPLLDFMVETVTGDETGVQIIVQSLLKDPERIDLFFKIGQQISHRMKR